MNRLDRTQLVIVGLVGCGLLAVVVTNFVKVSRTPSTNACFANLKQIQGAIEQWALENKITNATQSVTVSDISGSQTNYIKQLINQELKCPAGGTYSLTTVGEDPRCSVVGHTL